MLKFKIAQGLLSIISTMNHLCREAINCWVLQNTFQSTHIACGNNNNNNPNKK